MRASRGISTFLSADAHEAGSIEKVGAMAMCPATHKEPTNWALPVSASTIGQAPYARWIFPLNDANEWVVAVRMATT